MGDEEEAEEEKGESKGMKRKGREGARGNRKFGKKQTFPEGLVWSRSAQICLLRPERTKRCGRIRQARTHRKGHGWQHRSTQSPCPPARTTKFGPNLEESFSLQENFLLGGRGEEERKKRRKGR
jgi:hypothetical protein